MENYWRKVAEPCGDCVDGWCTMNCSSAVAPEPKAPRYTVTDSGRILMRSGDTPLAEAIDADPKLMQRIADLLNQHGEG